MTQCNTDLVDVSGLAETVLVVNGTGFANALATSKIDKVELALGWRVSGAYTAHILWTPVLRLVPVTVTTSRA